MLTLLYFLGGWADAWSASGRTDVSLEFVLGPEDRPKRAAWIIAEGRAVAGQLTVWDTGELECEAVRMDSGEQVLLESLVVESPEDLGSQIRRLISACDDLLLNAQDE